MLFESQTTRARILVAGLLALWVAMLAGDWWLRFRWYHWQQQVISVPRPESSGPFARLLDYDEPSRRGGDLSHLIGLPKVAAEFEETRPAFRQRTDEFGYRNVPPTTGTVYDVVVTGSSYMNSGVPMSNTIGARLEAELGKPVYNQAYPGLGPTVGLLRHLGDARFAARPPRVVVWGLVEREIGAKPLGGLVAQMERIGSVEPHAPARARISWGSFRPVFLRISLPNSSAIAQMSAKIWHRLRYEVFGKLPDDIAPSRSDLEGGRFLFYAHAVKALRWGEKERDLDGVVRVIVTVQSRLRARGSELVILLVPDKEQAYREWLPDRLASESNPLPPSCLIALEEKLRAAGIPVCNVLAPFRDRAAEGEFLYYRDDTHWNDRGVAIAARELARVVVPLLDAPR